MIQKKLYFFMAFVLVFINLMVACISTPLVDQYAVTYTYPSASSLGAMPVGNGRVAANVWVDATSADLMLSVGLADALDENSNLLKLGLVRISLDPPLHTGPAAFNQTLVTNS